MCVSAGTSKSLEQFQKLVNAEDYLEFFSIEYDQGFVNVNRLHILKQFALLIQEVDKVFPDLTEAQKLDKYGAAFTEAYELFKTSSPLETKLFKVFNEKPKNFVSLDQLTKKAN